MLHRSLPMMALVSLVASATMDAGEVYPYRAKVSVDTVDVRCGPGWNYYATGQLDRGEEVEVYRQQAGGWLAIRPVAGSFSLVAARHIKNVDADHIGQIATEGAVAWVGTTSHSVHQYKWQVRLKADERVDVLGSQAASMGPGFATETYYRIAPPAGEFRWIHAQQATLPGSAIQAADRGVERAGFHDSASGSPDRPRVADSHLATVAATSNSGTEGLAQKLRKLNLDLSLLVTTPMAGWDLAALQGRVEQLTGAASGTGLARDLRVISQRIDDFATLKRRYEQLGQGAAARASASPASTPAPSPASDLQPRELSVSATDSATTSLTESNRISTELDDHAVGTGVALAASHRSDTFDTEGWLMPVHSTKRIAPPYAVLDDDGRVRCYVTPSPGLNLRRYLRKRVGLFGQRRYVDALRAPHLTADRAVRLDKVPSPAASTAASIWNHLLHASDQ